MPKSKKAKRSKASNKRSNKSNASRRSVQFRRSNAKRAGKRGPRGMGLSPVSAPATQAFVQGWREPKFQHRSSQGFRVEHIEYLTDVAGYTNFGESGSISQFSINPGNSAIFPWLSGIANDFEQYTFHKLSAYYIPAGVSTATAGTVVLSPDYDPNDAVVGTDTSSTLSEAELLNFQDRQIGVPWAALSCPFNKGGMFPTGPRKYIDVGTYASDDARLIDAAQLLIAAYQASVDNTVFGKVFLHYDVECFIPARDISPVGDRAGATQYYNTTAQALTSGVAAYMGASGTWVGRGNTGITHSVGVFTVPVGWWKVTCRIGAQANAGAANVTDMSLLLYETVLGATTLIPGTTTGFTPAATALITGNLVTESLWYAQPSVAGSAYGQLNALVSVTGTTPTLVSDHCAIIFTKM